jgi:tRNA pseudouridine13 synthase
MRTRGFINYYGMQRFGTSTVPTHVTGLQILQSKWGEALDSILSLREGEHPDCVRARLAWLEDGDVEKALQIMPRRCVAERGIWEFWQKGGRKEDKLSALATVSWAFNFRGVHAVHAELSDRSVSRENLGLEADGER